MDFDYVRIECGCMCWVEDIAPVAVLLRRYRNLPEGRLIEGDLEDYAPAALYEAHLQTAHKNQVQLVTKYTPEDSARFLADVFLPSPPYYGAYQEPTKSRKKG